VSQPLDTEHRLEIAELLDPLWRRDELDPNLEWIIDCLQVADWLGSASIWVYGRSQGVRQLTGFLRRAAEVAIGPIRVHHEGGTKSLAKAEKAYRCGLHLCRVEALALDPDEQGALLLNTPRFGRDYPLRWVEFSKGDEFAYATGYDIALHRDRQRYQSLEYRDRQRYQSLESMIRSRGLLSYLCLPRHEGTSIRLPRPTDGDTNLHRGCASQGRLRLPT